MPGALDVLIETLKPARFTFWRLNFKDENTPPVDNLYARIGEGPPHLCFAGHVDVGAAGRCEAVEPPALCRGDRRRAPIRPRRRRHEGRDRLLHRGRARLRQERGRELDGSISLLITGDEEGPAINGTRKVLAWMKEQGERPDHCLVGEPTNAKRIGEAIKIGRRGSLNGWLKVTGVQGHVAYPHLANNPVKGLVKILSRYYDAPLDYGSAHFSPSNLEVTSIDVGNPTTNVIPAFAEARFNVRFNDRHSADALKAQLREQATLALSGTDLSVQPRVRAAERLLPHRARPARCAAQRGGERDHRAHALALDRRRDLGRPLHQGVLPGDRVRAHDRHHPQGRRARGDRRPRAAHRHLPPLHRALFRDLRGRRCRVIPGRSGCSTPAWAG